MTNEIITLSDDDLAAATGGADYGDRATAVAAHDEMAAVRFGNRLGDRLGLANNRMFGDNLGGRVGSALGFFYGANHGHLSATFNPSWGNQLNQKWGGQGMGELYNGARR